MLPISSKKPSSFRLSNVLRVVISLSLIAYCYYIIDIDIMLLSLVDIDTKLLFIAFIINIVGTIFFKSAVVWVLISGVRRVSYSSIVLINLVLRFYTVILPRAAVAGIRWYKYKSLTDGRQSLVLLSLEAVMTLFFLSLGASFFLQFEEGGEINQLVRVSVYLLSFLLLLAFFVFFIYPKNIFVDFAIRLTHKIKVFAFAERLIKTWVEVSEAFYLSGYKGWVVITFSALNYMFFLLSAYILMLAMGMELSFFVVAWVRSLILLLAHIPISVAGLGIREVGFVAFFGLYAVSPEQAVAYALVSFCLQLGIAVIGAVIELYNSLVGMGARNEG